MQHKNAEYFKRMENFIDKFTTEYTVSPTSQQISEGTGLSPATVSRYLRVMRDENVLDYGGIRNITTRRERQIRNKAYIFFLFSERYPAVSRSSPRRTLKSMSSFPLPFSGKATSLF